MLFRTIKRAFILSAAMLSLCLSPISAEVLDIPGTPAGKRANEILKLLNTGTPEAVEDYIRTCYAPNFRDAFPLAAHKAIFSTTQSMFGKMDVVDLKKSEATEIKLVLQSRSRDAWLNLTIMVEADEPHLIKSLGIAPGAQPEHLKKTPRESEAAAEKKAPQAAIEARDVSQEEWENFHRKISEKTAMDEFSGVILVAREGIPLFHRAYGLASKRFDVPNHLDTKFNLGSCNKLFTSIAILQLMEKGKLTLDDPIGKYLDVFPEDIARKVTIKHLLNMRSGWGDYWGNEAYLSRQNRLRKVSDYMDFIKDMPLDFEPGTNFQHSNTGFEVAGAIIEKVAGMDYYAYVKKHIYAPAGMTESGSYHRDGPVKNLAEGYTNMNPQDKAGEKYAWNNRYLTPPRGTPTGGGYSTTSDLLKFDRALRNHVLLSRAYTDFFLNRFEGKPGDPYTPKKMYRAIGGAAGIGAHMGIDFKTGYSVYILTNVDFPVVVEVSRDILELLGLN